MGYRIKIVRSDHGGEFLSNEFTVLCDERGIKRQFTVPYTPQQNDIVDSSNRTIMDTVRSLLKSKHVPGKLWGKL